jgi:hypothetical protein
MVNGAQCRVEVVAVTAVPPSTVISVADEDDARRRRHATPSAWRRRPTQMERRRDRGGVDLAAVGDLAC